MIEDPYKNHIIFQKYLVKNRIGKGSFGTVYSGIITQTHEKIAIKFEKREKGKNGTLETEACRLIYLQGPYIPKIICYGNNHTHNILVQELLGRSLENLFNLCNKKFSLKTVCVLGIEMIKRIEYIHNKYHIHRDIKPDNFMTGKDEKENKIYLIDFGLAKKYFSTSKQQHIKFSTGKSLTGTARYCSRNAHKGYEQSRRDDIESIGYVLLYFLRGNLPWQGIKCKNNEKHYEKIGNIKQITSIDELCSGFPEQFKQYFKYVKQLEFKDKPNYKFLIELFKNVLRKICGVKYIPPIHAGRSFLIDWNNNDSISKNSNSHRLRSKISLKNKNLKEKRKSSFNKNKISNNSNISIREYKNVEKRKNANDSSLYNIKETKDDTKNITTGDENANEKRRNDKKNKIYS